MARSEGTCGQEEVQLSELLAEPELAELKSSLEAPLLRGFAQLAEQSVRMGIDYASLGLGWEHPQSRTTYRKATHASITCTASLQRAEKSKDALVATLKGLTNGSRAGTDPGDALVKCFCEEVSAAPAARAGATLQGVLAALEAELVLPLRALNEDRKAGNSMTRTFEGKSLPPAPILACVDQITAAVLNGTYASWRYENPVGARQLEGLTAEQIAAWREPTRTEFPRGLVVHEDAPGELGLFWATKIGGPSHGFDYEGQCLLPLLANARHKVVLVTDPAWPHHPAGRAHFRFLWTATKPEKPVLWLETVNTDFDANVDSRPWGEAVVRHCVKKADAMGVMLSVSSQFMGLLQKVVGAGRVREVSDRLILRPSNGVVEASDYLSGEHDWLQLEDYITPALRRVVYEPDVEEGHKRPKH